MGMDATATIWVGVGADSGVGFSELEENEEVQLILEKNELEFSSIYCSEGECGSGFVILSHDWDYGTKEVDFDELKQKEEKAKLVFDEIFKITGVVVPIRTWIQTDFC